MKYIRLIIAAVILFFAEESLLAQSKYVTHTLQQGESLSVLAKQYNTSVGDIMRINGMHADTKLVYGSTIKIPSSQKQPVTALKSSNAVEYTSPAKTSSSGELTHIVAKGETLYSISKKFNITVDQIKAWNNLTDNGAKLGTLLVISEAGNNKFAGAAQKQKTEAVTAPQPKEPVSENKSDVKPTDATTDITTNMQPAMQTVNSMSNTAEVNTASYSGKGFFAPQYTDKKSKDISGVSKVFKTASGWADGKYYILANDIEPGTIVKVTADNGNSVYAKVLWNMGDLNDNAGINFRVSDATAAALRENNSSFNLHVSF